MAKSFENLLDDLDDLNSDEDNEEFSNSIRFASHGARNDMSDDDSQADEDGDEDAFIGDPDDLDARLGKIVKAKAASAIGQLRASASYRSHLQQIREALRSEWSESAAALEDDPEYQRILVCNRLVHEIDSEISETHRFVAENYAKKFPELESLILNKLDYIRTVQRIGNEMDMTVVELGDLLTSAAVMVVSVTGSTTAGQPLSENELATVLRACDEVIQLHEDKTNLLAFVESRMTHLAPNLSALIGARIAAQLVGLAGGIVPLAKIPSCNVKVMGQEKHHLSGFSSAAAMPNTGLLYYCEVVQAVPPFLRAKALKVVAGKVEVLARVDAFRNRSDRDRERASEGRRIRGEIEAKLEKMQEAPRARTKKALPVPEEKKKNRRGGKRVKKMKERYAVTELRQLQNRIGFKVDEGEYGDSAMGRDLGMVGHKDTGRIRGPQKKDTQQLAKRVKTVAASSGQTSGLSSSLVFTPVQGMELINPNAAAERVKQANNKWFNASSGFMSAAPK